MGIGEKLRDVNPRSIVMLEFPAEKNQIALAAEFLKFKEKTGSYGVYVSSNRSTNNLAAKIKEYGYDLKKDLENGSIWVVDLVSKGVGEIEESGVLYVASASELSATQLAIEKAISHIKGKGESHWLLLDSILTLLVFNSPDSLLEFLHFLLSRLRVFNFDGFIFTVRDGIEGKMLSTITQFCDAKIKL